MRETLPHHVAAELVDVVSNPAKKRMKMFEMAATSKDLLSGNDFESAAFKASTTRSIMSFRATSPVLFALCSICFFIIWTKKSNGFVGTNSIRPGNHSKSFGKAKNDVHWRMAFNVPI